MIYPLLNTILLLGALFINFCAATGKLNGITIGEISDQYYNLITPAGYAFSIWSVIYFLLIGFVVQNWIEWKQNKPVKTYKKVGVWFLINCTFNILWVVLWVHGYTAASLVLMFSILVTLIAIVLQLNMSLWQAPIRTIIWTRWPFTIYLGWIILASVANTSAYLVSVGWNGFGLPNTTWAIIMITISSLIYLVLVFKRNLKETAFVGIWGFIAIMVKQNQEHGLVYFTALIGAIFLFIAVCYHTYLNRDTLQV